MNKILSWVIDPIRRKPQYGWWYREDRDSLARFIDFFCERIYFAVMGVLIVFLITLAVLFAVSS
jgi:hypothetical protein